MNSKQKTFTLFSIILLVAPLITSAAGAVFENPVPNLTIAGFMQNILLFFLALAGFLALLGIVYGATMIILGGMRSEQDLKRGKEIIFWAIAGMLITGIAAVILVVIRTWLGV